MENKKNKRPMAAAALVMAIILILGGTYAWTDYSQHKSNEFSTGEKYLYDVTLIDDFVEVKDWQQGQEVTSKIKVKNMSTASGDAYVRLALKEYLEFGDLDETFSDERYMIDTNGEFLKSDKATQGEALAEILSIWGDSRYQGIAEADLVQDSGYTDDDDYWYVKTKGGDPNGQYGKFLLRTSEYDTASLVTGVNRSYHAYDEEWHQKYPNGECDYTTRVWPVNIANLNTSDTHGFTTYISWKLGTNVETIGSWDGFVGKDAKWYLDTDEGYAYWGKALAPGQETDILLDAVTLKNRPEADYFYYNVHADMEAVSDGGDFDTNVETERSEPPTIDYVFTSSMNITGTGVPGAEVTVTFPNSATRTAEVSSDREWFVTCPVRLNSGESVYAYQVELGKTASDEVSQIVRSD